MCNTMHVPLLSPQHQSPPLSDPTPIATTKRQKLVDIRPSREVPADVGELIRRDVKLVRKLGQETFVNNQRGRSDLMEMIGVNHPAQKLLQRYALCEVPV